MSVADEVEHLLARLSRFEPSDAPVLSLYLNTQPDQRGRDQFGAFLKKELHERVVAFDAPRRVQERLEADVRRVESFLLDELQPSANGVAVFACGAAGLFETLQTEAPIEAHALSIASTPQLYPLARLSERYPRYAVLLTDTNTARIVLVALNTRVDEQLVQSPKTARTGGSGWSQMNYQRHVDHERLHHVKEVIERLELVVRRDRIDTVVLAGEERILPVVRDHLPQAVAALVVDRIRIDVDASARELLDRTLESVRHQQLLTDRQLVEHAFDAHRAGGLAALGLEHTRASLVRGQVHVLLLSAHPDRPADDAAETPDPDRPRTLSVDAANDLLRRARQTDAEVRLIDDPTLLAGVGGVASLLRFRI